MSKPKIKKYFVFFIILLISAISLVFLGLHLNFKKPNNTDLSTKLKNQSVSLVEDNNDSELVRRIKQHSASHLRWNANANFSSYPTKDGGSLVLTSDGGIDRLDSFGYKKWSYLPNSNNKLARTDENQNLIYNKNNNLETLTTTTEFLQSVDTKIVSEAIQSNEDESIFYLLLVPAQLIDNEVNDQFYSLQQLSTDFGIQGTILKIKEDLNHVRESYGIVDYANISPKALIDNYPATWTKNTPSIYGVNGSFKKTEHPTWFSEGNGDNFISLPWLQYITNLANLYEYQGNVFLFGGNGNWIKQDDKDRKLASSYLSMGVFRVRFHDDKNIRPNVSGYPYAYLLSSLTSSHQDTQRVLLGQNKNYTLVPRIAVAGVKPALNYSNDYLFLFGSVTTGLDADDNANSVVLNKDNYSDAKLKQLNTLSSTPLVANDAKKNSVGPRVLAGFFFNLSDLAKLDDKIDESNVDKTYYLNQNSYGFRIIAPWTTKSAQTQNDALTTIGSNNQGVEGTLFNLTVRHGFNENDVGNLIILDDSSYAVQVGPYILTIDGPSPATLRNDVPFNLLHQLSNQDFLVYDINSSIGISTIFNFKDFRGIRAIKTNQTYLFSLFAPSSATASKPKVYYHSFNKNTNNQTNFYSQTINSEINGIVNVSANDALYIQLNDYSFNSFSLSANAISDEGLVNPITKRISFLGQGRFINNRDINLNQNNLANLFDFNQKETTLKNDLINSVYEYYPAKNNPNYQLKLKAVDLDYEHAKFRLVPYVLNNLTNRYEIIPDSNSQLNSDESFGNFNNFTPIDTIYLYIGVSVPIVIFIILMIAIVFVGVSIIRQRNNMVKSFNKNSLRVDGLVISIGSVFKSLITKSKQFKRLSIKAKEEPKPALKQLTGKVRTEQNNIINTNNQNNQIVNNNQNQVVINNQKPVISNTKHIPFEIKPIKQTTQTIQAPITPPTELKKDDTKRVNFNKMREYKQKTKMIGIE
ncbi:cytadherence protein B [Mycoplasma sp. E35C]|uniref:cytadherence protein B n=1 Tax=Mycoplasma sp. E35C TaxID=2801918 RepID=UPI001CA41396|nr:cytadherence protein B [Mycoplasma sp. E35C]QZX49292.1 cytadherence protein B [Mycoplasma sp. E35C]